MFYLYWCGTWSFTLRERHMLRVFENRVLKHYGLKMEVMIGGWRKIHNEGFCRIFVFAQHILQNQHEYGQMSSIMTLLKPLNSPSMLIPYKQYYIQTLHQEGKVILEQYPGELNPLFQTVINPQPPHTT